MATQLDKRTFSQRRSQGPLQQASAAQHSVLGSQLQSRVRQWLGQEQERFNHQAMVGPSLRPSRLKPPLDRRLESPGHFAQ
jgi:hypothetical protein